jgi:hypothetical protein
MKINPHDPAYPCDPQQFSHYQGLPIRLAIAAQMMAGFASWSGSREATPDYIPVDKAATCSLQWADALIAAYNEGEK